MLMAEAGKVHEDNRADPVPYIFCSTKEVFFGVRQLAAALNRAKFPPRQLADVVAREAGHRELLPPRPRIYRASKLARSNLE
jgi:hypothetical protein